MPRLGRRRLDLPLARPARARLRRLGAARDHGLRGEESEEDARFCREDFGAEVVEAARHGTTEAELRDLRYRSPIDRLRATGHTACDQVEAMLLGLVASGSPQRIKAQARGRGRAAAARLWREETRAYCDERGLPYREDSSNPGTKRGLIRDEVLPLLERLDPGARASLLSLADEQRRLPRKLERTLGDLLATHEERRPPTSAAASAPCASTTPSGSRNRPVGAVDDRVDREGLDVRTRRPGDHLAGRKKVRISSWTRRCRGRSGTSGRSSSPVKR